MKEICEKLDMLICEMRWTVYVSDSKLMLCHLAYAVSCFSNILKKVSLRFLFQCIKILLDLPPIRRKFDLDYLGQFRLLVILCSFKVIIQMEVNDAW